MRYQNPLPRTAEPLNARSTAMMYGMTFFFLGLCATLAALYVIKKTS